MQSVGWEWAEMLAARGVPSGVPGMTEKVGVLHTETQHASGVRIMRIEYGLSPVRKRGGNNSRVVDRPPDIGLREPPLLVHRTRP